MTAPWFDTRDLDVRHVGRMVELSGHGRVFEGCLVIDDGRRRWRGRTIDGDLVNIPRKIAPLFWRPAEGRHWPYALPHVAIDTPIAPVFKDIRPLQRITHVASIDDLTDGRVDADWPFEYARPGAISRSESEHRLLRALKTSRAPGIVKNIALGAKSNWPVHQMVAEWGDYPDPITVRAFEPTRRDLDDWWRALSWLCALYPHHTRPKDYKADQMNADQKIVVWRSCDPAYGWRHIGEEFARSNEWARRRYNRALDTIAVAANKPECEARGGIDGS